jgi:hypothetical protein
MYYTVRAYLWFENESDADNVYNYLAPYDSQSVDNIHDEPICRSSSYSIPEYPYGLYYVFFYVTLANETLRNSIKDYLLSIKHLCTQDAPYQSIDVYDIGENLRGDTVINNIKWDWGGIPC